MLKPEGHQAKLFFLFLFFSSLFFSSKFVEKTCEPTMGTRVGAVGVWGRAPTVGMKANPLELDNTFTPSTSIFFCRQMWSKEDITQMRL
jgi:hypothetical protein